MNDFRTIRVSLRDHVLGKPIAPEREVRFRSEGETALRSDAVVAVRYGQHGQAVYARGIRLPVHAPAAVILTAEHFPPFRDATPEILGWAERPELDWRGQFGPDADPIHWDPDWTRVGGAGRGYYNCSRCVTSGLLPKEVYVVSADGSRDYGPLLGAPVRNAAAGPLGDTLRVLCSSCHAAAARFDRAGAPANLAAELHPIPPAAGAGTTAPHRAVGPVGSVSCPDGHEITGAVQFAYITARLNGFQEGEPIYSGTSDVHWDGQSSFRQTGDGLVRPCEETDPEALYVCAEGDEHRYRDLRF